MNQEKKHRIVMTGGGTGGHVTPNLALIPRLQADGWEIHYIGGRNSVEEENISRQPGVKFYGVSVGKLRRYFDPKNFSDPFRVVRGVCEATSLIRKIKPDVVFSKGGFVSVPVVYGAKLNHVPVVTHESDLTPGLANKLCLPFAKCQCCTFPEAVAYTKGKGVYTGSPIREELFQGDRERGMKRFGFVENKPILMVVGGSSGAEAINKAVRDTLDKLTEHFQILHICGKGHLSDVYQNVHHYVQVEYLDKEMADAYACADILISRAGANSLSEIHALRKPALLIPYPKGASRGDQIQNAKSFQNSGFSMVMDQADLNPETLYKAVIDLYHYRGTLIEKMAGDKIENGLEAVLEQIYKYAK